MAFTLKMNSVEYTKITEYFHCPTVIYVTLKMATTYGAALTYTFGNDGLTHFISKREYKKIRHDFTYLTLRSMFGASHTWKQIQGQVNNGKSKLSVYDKVDIPKGLVTPIQECLETTKPLVLDIITPPHRNASLISHSTLGLNATSCITIAGS